MKKTANVQNINTNIEASDRAGTNWSYVLEVTLKGLVVLAGVVFWLTFVYVMITGNVKLAMIFGQIIGVMAGVAVPIMLIQKLHEHIHRK